MGNGILDRIHVLTSEQDSPAVVEIFGDHEHSLVEPTELLKKSPAGRQGTAAEVERSVAWFDGKRITDEIDGHAVFPLPVLKDE